MEPLVLAVLVAACVLPVIALGWSLLVIARRLGEHNRDLLKAVLAMSERSGTVLAGAMETTDRGARPQPMPTPRQVGS